MSFDRFRASIRPDRRVRRCVAGAAIAAALLGSALLLGLPVAAPWRALLLAGWLAVSVRELRTWRRAARRIDRLQIGADGLVTGHDDSGAVLSLELLPGTIVGARAAWLRLGFDDGDHYGELLLGNPVDPDWRRLQLHWQQTRLKGR